MPLLQTSNRKLLNDSYYVRKGKFDLSEGKPYILILIWRPLPLNDKEVTWAKPMMMKPIVLILDGSSEHGAHNIWSK